MSTLSPLDEVEDVLERGQQVIRQAARLIPAHPKTPNARDEAEREAQLQALRAQIEAWGQEIRDDRHRLMVSVLSESEKQIVEETKRRYQIEVIGLLDQARAAHEAQEELMRRRAERRAFYQEMDQDPEFQQFLGELTEGDGK